MIRTHGLTDTKLRATPVEEDTMESKTSSSSSSGDNKPDYAQTLLAKLLHAEGRITELNSVCISKDSDILRLERQLQKQTTVSKSSSESRFELDNSRIQSEPCIYNEEYAASLEQQVLALNHTIDLLKFENFETKTKLDEEDKRIKCWMKKSSDLEDIIISQQNEIRQLKMSNAYHEEHYSSLKTSYEVMACINQRTLESSPAKPQAPEQNPIPPYLQISQFEIESPHNRSNSKLKPKVLSQSYNLSGVLKHIPKMAASYVMKSKQDSVKKLVSTPRTDRDRPPTVNKSVTPRNGKSSNYTPSFMRTRRPSPFEESMK